LFENMIRVPFIAIGSVALDLEFFDGTSVTIMGSGVRIELAGPHKNVEALPQEWAPSEGAA
jgi:hypothetical protein